MRIESSSVGLQSQHALFQKHVVRESLEVWGPGRRQGGAPRAASPGPVRPRLPAPAPPPPDAPEKSDEIQDDEALDPGLLALKYLIEKMLGHKIRLLSLKDLQPHADPIELQDPANAQAQAQAAPQQQAGAEYNRYESYQEVEAAQFSAAGVVRTTDGKEIAFKLELQMQREFFTEDNLTIRVGAPKAKDPLVINFGGSAAQLTDARFSFDLDGDGTAESMPVLASGSGFLAFDRNGDGSINSGQELFGAATGNGFSELAAYDEDGNHWIDENDSIFNKLSVWTKAGDGAETQLSLAQAGVGAIYLENVSTPFDLKSADNTTRGNIRSTSVVLMENGTVGTVQQMDVVV